MARAQVRRPGAWNAADIQRRGAEFLWNTQRTFRDLIDGVTDPKQLMDMVMPGSPDDAVTRALELVRMGMGDVFPDEATRAVKGIRAGMDALRPDEGKGAVPERTWQDDICRSFGLTARALVEGLLGFGDTFGLPARVPMNLVNGFLGGDYNYFKPLSGGATSDFLGLPKAETDLEKFVLNINTSLASLLPTLGTGLFLKAEEATSALPTLIQKTRELFTSNPGAQAAAMATTSAAMDAAEKAGLGLKEQTIIGLIAAWATGRVATSAELGVGRTAVSSAELGTGRAAVNGAATEARAVKTGLGAMAEEAAGAVKAGTRTAAEEGLASSGASAGRAARKPDPFALTPESMGDAIAKSPYKDKAGQIIAVDPAEVRFSQTTISYKRTRDIPGKGEITYTLDDIREGLYKNGWPLDEPIEAVIMPPDGRLTSVDNSRLTLAGELGVDKSGRPIKPLVRVRRPDEPLTTEEKARFSDKKRSLSRKHGETWLVSVLDANAARRQVRNMD